MPLTVTQLYSHVPSFSLNAYSLSPTPTSIDYLRMNREKYRSRMRAHRTALNHRESMSSRFVWMMFFFAREVLVDYRMRIFWDEGEDFGMWAAHTQFSHVSFNCMTKFDKEYKMRKLLSSAESRVWNIPMHTYPHTTHIPEDPPTCQKRKGTKRARELNLTTKNKLKWKYRIVHVTFLCNFPRRLPHISRQFGCCRCRAP
jgi:hypothetical protein